MKSRDEANEEIVEIVAWLRKAYRKPDQSTYCVTCSDATTMHQVLEVRSGAVVIEDSTTTFGPWMLDFEILVASEVRELFALAYQVSDDRGQHSDAAPILSTSTNRSGDIVAKTASSTPERDSRAKATREFWHSK